MALPGPPISSWLSEQEFKALYYRVLGRSELSSNGCLIWKGSTTRKEGNGYGVVPVRVDGHVKNVTAHRVACEYVNGAPCPEKDFALHRCDQPRCVNGVHLFWGTLKENSQDCVNKGRHRGPYDNATTCIHGHPFTRENTIKYAGKRACRECARRRTKEYQAKHRAGAV